MLPRLDPDIRRCLGDGFLHVVVGVYHDMTKLVDANKKSSTSCLKSPKTPESVCISFECLKGSRKLYKSAAS